MSEPTREWQPSAPGQPTATGPTRVPIEALLDDQRRRWRRGAAATVEMYQELYPALRTDPEGALDLIYNEVLLREQAGESPQLADYLQRFPQWASLLEDQFEVHRALASDPPASVVSDQPTVYPAAALATTLDDAAPPAGSARAVALPSVPGYEILEELGRGGMGVVYLARQIRLNRPCALKMILAGDHAGPEAALRFLAEAETVARLRHPNIVQIYAIGDHDGRPYCELEYIEGGSLADRLDGTPWPAPQAARLVETLAHTMHAAHQLGVVHRDLKPANVLLAVDGTPKLTDFGLAKSLLTDSGLTQTETILGSPSYMAPEQAEGKAKAVGPVADVYALGAILYELLTGRPPFRAATVLETLEQVKSAEAVPPSRLQPSLPRDLETITLKCLQKEPSRRYASAELLAEDLRRLLHGEPIRAQPVGVWERCLKWVRRRPFEAALWAVTGLAVLSLIWAVTSLSYQRSLVANNRRLDAALRDAGQQRARAKKCFDQARDVVDHFITLIEKQLDEPQLKPVRDALLADGLAYYRGVLQQWGDTPDLQVELIRTYTGAAKVAESLGATEEALTAYQQALALLEKLVHDYPDAPRYRLDLAEVHHSLGAFYSNTGQIGAALRAFEAGRTIREQLQNDHPDDPRILTDLARSHGYIGDLLLAAGRLAEADASYRRSHEIRRQLAQAQPDNPVLRFQLARSYSNLARLGRQAGRLDEALNSCQRAIALQEGLAAEGPALKEFRGDLAWTSNELGLLLRESGQPAEALVPLRKARTLYQKLIQDHPGISDYRSGLGTSVFNLGAAQRELGQTDAALRSCREARDLLDKLAAENPKITDYRSGLAQSYDEVGKLLGQVGRLDEARQSCERAVTLLDGLVRDDPGNLGYRSDRGEALADLGLMWARLGRPREAMETLRQAIAEQQRAVARAPQMAQYRRRLEAHQAALADAGRAVGEDAPPRDRPR